MCGITGIYHSNLQAVNAEILQRMTRQLAHRGPDDEGFFLDTETGLGFRRLSILDLSQSGHQPMCNTDRTLWIVFNGEIYNYIELRDELRSKGYDFRSQTDTEVILAAYHCWGEDCLNRFNGMWAFAIWDVNKRELFCARDRFGEKPFYYFCNEQIFLFASEIKALLVHPLVPRKPNDQIIYYFLTENIRDWNEETFFEGILQLPPGHCLRIGQNYLSLKSYYRLNPDSFGTSQLTEKAAAEKFRELFEDAVRLRLRSDVPVGSCLSGGLDSSSVVCVMNRLLQSEHPLTKAIGEQQKTFSARSENADIDEGPYMHAILAATGAEANFTTPTAEEVVKSLDHFIYHMEEPMPSTSMFAQYCVMRLARQRGVTVLLDGQGADETLGGYNHALLTYFASQLRRFRWIRALNESRRLDRPLSLGAWITIFCFALPAGIGNPIYRLARRHLPDPLSASFRKKYRHLPPARGTEPDLNQKLMNDMKFILRSLLMYEDKNSMAFSIEARVPFLDYRLVEFIFSLPDNMKIRKGLRKAVLRDAMKNIVPDSILERKDKIGFATAEFQWLNNGPLREKMLEVFASSTFQQRPYFQTKKIYDSFQALPSSPPAKAPHHFWACFNLELWLRQYIDPPSYPNTNSA